MNDAAITTIILTYRRPELLARAIRSALAQSFKNLIVHVYDDASGDQTAEVVAAFASQDSRVIYHQHPHNVGAVANYNYALSRVRTPYVSMLSDDDLLMPQFFERAVEGLTANPTAGCFCARTVVYQSAEKWIRLQPVTWQRGLHDASIENTLHMIHEHFPTTGVLFKREVVDAVGEFNRFASDHIYMTQVASAFPFVVSDYEAGVFTVHPASFTGRKSLRLGDQGHGRSSIEATEEWLLYFLAMLVTLESRDVSERMHLFAALYKFAGRVLTGDCVRALAERRFDDYRFAMRELRPLPVSFGVRAAILGASLAPVSLISRGAAVFTAFKTAWLRSKSESQFMELINRLQTVQILEALPGALRKH